MVTCIKAGIHEMPANMEDPNQTASYQGLLCLSKPLAGFV